MKPRTTLILAVILLVLAGVATLFQTAKRKSQSSEGRPIFPAFSATEADAIDIEGQAKPVNLRKQGEKWIVASEGRHEADPKLVKQILEGMDKFTTTALISTSKEKQSAFEVDSTGITVRLGRGGKRLAEFVVGKPGPDFMSTYVRPVGQDRVYQVPVYLRTVVDRGTDTWRNTMILDLDQANVTGLTSHTARGTVTCEKGEDGAWKLTAPFEAPAKTDVMSMILRSVAQVRATGFADTTLTPAVTGLSPDTTSIEVRTSDGSTYKLLIGATTDKNQSYTQREGDPTIFLVPRGRWNTVLRPADQLRALESAPVVTPPVPPGPKPAGS